MEKVRLHLSLLACLLIYFPNQAQTLFNNANHLVVGSDNTGDPDHQPGTEVLHSTPGLGVSLAPDGSYEHVGQFYVAANGIWNRTEANGQSTIGTDYFGYAPNGANTAYVGKGILGASTCNGGNGIGRPTFGHLHLNSTGEFPLEGGMYVTHSLRFNANGPGKANLITTPNSTNPDSPLNSVVFAPTANIEGADNQNYINGFASVTGVLHSFMLPLGDPASFPYALRPLTITTATAGTVTARYLHMVQHPTDALGEGIGSMSLVGSWPISAPVGTSVTVSLPNLSLSSAEASTLRLIGWNGNQWINLSQSTMAKACGSVDCPLTGTISAHITNIAIGSTSRSVFNKGEADALILTLWPNPTQSQLNVAITSGKTIHQLQAIDLQGHPVTNPITGGTTLNTSALPSGSYLLEVITTQGQTLRKHFVKQP